MLGIQGFSTLITGGGSGIGLAAAKRFAAGGAHVTICGRTASRLDAAAEEIESVSVAGASVTKVAADVTVEDDVMRAVEIATAVTGRLDGLVASAGGSLHMGPIVAADIESVRATIDLNLVGTFLCVKHAGRVMARQGGGSIVGVSSHTGRDTFRSLSIYGAAKAGLDQLCRAAADELGGVGVRVNSIQPGIVSTDLMAPITGGGDLLDDYIENIPLGRVGEPEEIAELARFLIGPESSWITGQVIAIDGGQNVRRGANFHLIARDLYGEDVVRGLVDET